MQVISPKVSSAITDFVAEVDLARTGYGCVQ